MTDDERRADIERKAVLRLTITPIEGCKPEHFGFYAERVHNGFDVIGMLIAGTDTQFRAAGTMMALYYEKFAGDNNDVRFINRVVLDIMAKGATRPTAWEVALQYHNHVRQTVGPDYDLDNYRVVVMTEEEATPEVVTAFMGLANDNPTRH